VIAWAGAALAAGYYQPDAGIVAMGRGGAFCAGADDQYAQYYNPAGLVRVDAPTLNAGLAELHEGISFSRADADGLRPAVHNQAGWFGIPELGFVTPLPHGFALAIGFFAPYAPAVRFPADGAQRYAIIESDIAKFDVGPSIAWRPVPAVAVGAGVSWQVLTVGERLAATTSGTDDPAGDVVVDARVRDRFTPGASVGVLFEPVPALAFGASFVPRSRFRARGTGTLDFTGNGLAPSLDHAVWTDDDIALVVALPAVVRVGVAVRPGRFEVEADAVWEGWHALGDVTVTDIDLTVTGELFGHPTSVPVPKELALPSGFQDAGSIRVGAEWKATDRLALRIGGLVESSSLSARNVSVSLVDLPKVQAGAGFSAEVPRARLGIDGALGLVAFRSAELRDSTVTQIDFGDSAPLVVGNGTMSAHAVTGGLAVRWKLGDRADPAPDFF
jgi:long-chain fatty acid transport protein